jgi:hypothetical protein
MKEQQKDNVAIKAKAVDTVVFTAVETAISSAQAVFTNVETPISMI